MLGHRGMLGSVVSRYLAEQGFRVITSERRYGAEPESALLEDVAAAHADAVVNCLGAIPAAGRSGTEVMTSNALLPSHLAAVLGGTLLIHASTDCVFDGGRGHYSIDDAPNSTDAYGLSKRIGEACAFWPNTVILRTSIVGPSAGEGRGLLGWFLSHDGPVDGWTDHLWNGITTLAWAELAARTIEGTGLRPGMHHPTTLGTVSKEELLRLFADVFDHRIEIRPTATGRALDRTLVPTVEMAPLLEQLIALRGWMRG